LGFGHAELNFAYFYPNQNSVFSMKNTFYMFLFLFGMANIQAQSVAGKWKAQDDESGKEAIIEITDRNGMLYGKIVQLMQPPPSPNCDKCTDERKGQPLLGLEIIRDMKAQGDNEYDDGTILDPKRGQVYDCFLRLESANKLKVRGYVGISLFGRTQYWIRTN
jgi:uncharacterized protein (DUF2147 family)